MIENFLLKDCALHNIKDLHSNININSFEKTYFVVHVIMEPIFKFTNWRF